MIIFYPLFILYGLSHIYIFICLRRAFGGGWWQLPALVWLAGMALSWFFRFGRPAGQIGEKFQDVMFVWMGLLVFLCYCLLSLDFAALLVRTVAFVSNAGFMQKLSAFFVASRYVPAALGLACILFCYSLYEAQTPRLRHLHLTTNKLPASSPGLRIVGIADVHISSLIGNWTLQRMAGKIASVDPDILVVGGDLVDTDVRRKEEEAAILASIPARLGKFAVTGNHESYHGLQMSLDFMIKSGLQPLRGQVVEVGGISIAGVDDGNFAGRLGPETTDVMRALDKAPKGRFILLLNHKPYYPEEAVGRFDLQFSGHTHAGQFWPGEYITRRLFGARQGLNLLQGENGDSLLYITNGIGFWGPPIRFLAPPEITVITLTPEPVSQDG